MSAPTDARTDGTGPGGARDGGAAPRADERRLTLESYVLDFIPTAIATTPKPAAIRWRCRK